MLLCCLQVGELGLQVLDMAFLPFPEGALTTFEECSLAEAAAMGADGTG